MKRKPLKLHSKPSKDEKTNPVPRAIYLTSMTAIKKAVSQTYNQLKKDEISANKARALGYLLNTAIKCFEVSDMAKELEEMRERLDALETSKL